MTEDEVDTLDTRTRFSSNHKKRKKKGGRGEGVREGRRKEKAERESRPWDPP